LGARHPSKSFKQFDLSHGPVPKLPKYLSTFLFDKLFDNAILLYMYVTIPKNKKEISIRELIQKPVLLTNMARRGQDFIITKYGKPLLNVKPIKKLSANTVKEFKSLMFRSGEKHLSKKIDKIVYGS
jgi:hypothetical protein